MSFEVFLSCYKNGETSTFPLSVLENALAHYADRCDEQHYWVLEFPDGSNSELGLQPGAQIEGCTVFRPSDSPELWNGLIEILKRTMSVLYWPGGPPVVADAAVIPHVPKDMIESLGEPVVTTDREKIFELIRNS